MARIRTAFIGLGLTILSGGLSPAEEAPCPVELVLEVASSDIRPGSDSSISPGAFRASLKNVGPRAISLVRPADGSSRRLRTPFFFWSIEMKGGDYAPPEDLFFCERINPVREDALLRLGPGGVVDISDEIPRFWVQHPGEYLVQLHYENNPTLEFAATTSGQHNPDVLRMIRTSSTCNVASNKAAIRVVSVPPADGLSFRYRLSIEALAVFFRLESPETEAVDQRKVQTLLGQIDKMQVGDYIEGYLDLRDDGLMSPLYLGIYKPTDHRWEVLFFTTTALASKLSSRLAGLEDSEKAP